MQCGPSIAAARAELFDARRPAGGRRRGAPLVAAALALAAGLHAGTAHADARTEARRHFKAGMALVAQKKLVEGIKELEKAYEIYPHPNVAYNVAAAQTELGNYDLAIAAYRSYLDSNPSDRAQVEKIIADLQEKLATQKVGPEAPPAGGKPGEVKPGEAKPGEARAGRGQAGRDEAGRGQAGRDEAGRGQAGRDEAGRDEAAGAGPGRAAGRPAAGGESASGAARTEDVYQETVVTASRGAQSPLDSPNSTSIITKQDIHLSGITRIPEAGAPARRQHGRDGGSTGGDEERPTMRGFNSRQANKLLVLVNGRSVYNDILGSTFWESFSIDVDQIERIEVVRGPGSALYGADAFAGVINIITIAPGVGKPGARVGIGDGGQGLRIGLGLGAEEGDFAYRASVGYTRYPRWTREVADGRRDVTTGDFDQNLAVENLRANLGLSYRINKDNQIELSGGFARLALEFYGIGPFNDFELKGDNIDVALGYKGKYINAKAYFDRLDVTARGRTTSTSATRSTRRTRSRTCSTSRAEYVNDFRTKGLDHDIHAGLGYRLKDIIWSYLEQPTPVEHHFSAYVQDTLKIGDKVNLVASGRADYVPYLLKRVVGSPRGIGRLQADRPSGPALLGLHRVPDAELPRGVPGPAGRAHPAGRERHLVDEAADGPGLRPPARAGDERRGQLPQPAERLLRVRAHRLLQPGDEPHRVLAPVPAGRRSSPTRGPASAATTRRRGRTPPGSADGTTPPRSTTSSAARSAPARTRWRASTSSPTTRSTTTSSRTSPPARSPTSARATTRSTPASSSAPSSA